MPVSDDRHRQDRTFSDSTQAGQADNWATEAVKGDSRLVGTMFAGKYQVLSELGEGGMSVVYLVRHAGLDKLMALKVLHTHLAARGTSQLRFQQEARSASQLSHPSIIGMHDFGITDDGTPYLVMDYVEGESLANVLSKKGYLSFDTAFPIFLQTCSALAHAHERGVIHRDLKPSNIMLKRLTDGSLHVLVVDFGVAKVVSDPSETPGKLTQTGEFVGSPFYMSPEQCAGKPLDARADIYSMACVIYEILTGHVPFEGDSIYSILFKHMNEGAPPISSLRPDLKNIPSLEKTLLKALAKDPSARYKTMSDLASALKECKNKPSLGKKISDKYETLQLTGQLKKLLIAAACLGAILLITTAALANPRPLLQAANILPPDVTEFNNVYPIYPPSREPESIDDLTYTQKSVSANAGVRMAEQFDRQSTVPDPQGLAKRYTTRGTVPFQYGKYDDAIEFFEKALDTLNKCKKDHACIEESERETSLRLVYTYLGECQYRLKNWKKAEVCFGDRLKIDRKIYLERRWLYDREAFLKAELLQADCLYRLGNMKGVYEIMSAPGLYETVEQILPPQFIATSTSEYADAALKLQHDKVAETKYKRAAEAWGSLPDGAKYVVLAKGGLALSQANQRLNDQAKASYEAAFSSVERLPSSLMSDHEIADVLQNYSNFLLKRSNLVFNSPDFFRAVQVYEKAKLFRRS